MDSEAPANMEDLWYQTIGMLPCKIDPVNIDDL